MAKRIIKIILILLGIFAFILLMIWLIGRGKAQKAGQQPQSFKQFLGLSTKTNSGQAIPGETSSTFTGNGANGGSNNGGPGGTAGSFNGSSSDFTLDNGTGVSQFTDNGISLSNGPAGSSGGTGNGTNGNNGGSSNGTTGNGTGNGTNGSGTGSGNGSGNGTDSGSANGSDATPVCSQEDTTIDFTPEEIAQLNELQNRFYTIAQTLHTDADVDTEVANHDAFAVKADQVTELYNYCESKLPSITDPTLQQHVATPFWHTDNDSLSLLNFQSSGGIDAEHLTQVHDGNTDPKHNADTSNIKGPWGVLSWSNPQAVSINGSILTGSVVTLPDGRKITARAADSQLLLPVVEKILRINLW